MVKVVKIKKFPTYTSISKTHVPAKKVEVLLEKVKKIFKRDVKNKKPKTTKF